MRSRSSILVGLLIVLFFSPLAFGAPEFKTYLPNSVDLNPGDEGVLVHEMRVEGVASPLRVKELTVSNEGTASGNELAEIRVRYRKGSGSWSTVSLEELPGLDSGITFSLPGDGVTLRPGEVAEFRLVVSVESAKKVPVSKFGQSVSLSLSGTFHYVYLNDDGEAVESISSNRVSDPGTDRIVRAGFEEKESLPLDTDILQPGRSVRIGSYVFRDRDANQAGVAVDLITVKNESGAEETVVLGEDVTEITLRLRIREGDEVTERTVRRRIDGPTTRVTFPTEPGGWWDGRCGDGCELSLDIVGRISESGPVQDMELRTGVRLDTRESNGTSGYPFRQEVLVPQGSVQNVVLGGLEGIEETTDWRSGVINRGETYTQRLTLTDEDRDSDDFMVETVSFRNEGSLESSGVESISVYGIRPDGSMEELASGLKLASEWQPLDGGKVSRIPDDGRGDFAIHYEISEDATSGATFRPVVRFRGAEGAVKGLSSPVHRSPETLTVYPFGAEIAEANRGDLSQSPITGREGLIGQRIDVMDRDENRLDLLINPIVIKNTGTATGSDFRKLELYDSDGELLVSKTDLRGLNTSGVTLDNLDGKTRVTDRQPGNWRTFYIYLVPRAGIREETLDLETTLYMTEGKRDVVKKLQGPRRLVVRRRYTTGGSTTTTRTRTTTRTPRTVQTGGESQPFRFGLAAGASYRNFAALSAKAFLEVPLDELGLEFGPTSPGFAYSRFGFEIDSLTRSGYYYPNVSFGYNWPYGPGVDQFVGAGGGAALMTDPDVGSTFGVHGLYGITTTELFEEDLPVLLQAQLKYLNEPVSETVFGLDFGVLFE